ncbi:MAG: T9SS type A sorting domain-containing protein [Candidatus Krumholzibacteriota bacterium]|nr:T9SS type A sorting domain-containing protein [Candidatus Krumholzibacteriota bacterium]
MKKCIFMLLLIVFLGVPAHAQKPEVVIGPGLNTGRTEYHQDWDRALSADSCYIITGLYYVDSLYSITIPPGTIIKGDTASTLIISRGAQIHATGQPNNPIVFTSLKPRCTREPGDWGGVIILGRAPVNKYEPLIEGGIIGGSYGGSDPDDDSGEFCYVRIEYPGYRFQLNNEVNGLTMGGVGRGTELHHVQVSYSFDDSYEWFGGTVNAKYLVAYGGTDDEFDTDFGYQGLIQYCFGLRDRYYWDPTGQSNGFESDNDGSSSSTAEPHTAPKFSNVTLIGPRWGENCEDPPPGHSYQFSAVLRRSTQTSVYNSVIAGYPWGISNRDSYTHKFSVDGDLTWRDVSMAAHLQAPGEATIHEGDRWPGSPPCPPTGSYPDSVTWWFRSMNNNFDGGTCGTHVARYADDLGIYMPCELCPPQIPPGAPNPVPVVGSEPDVAGTNFVGLPEFFDSTSYRGAFDPTLPWIGQWTAGWTNFCPCATPYNEALSNTEDEIPGTGVLLQNYPNPFNPATIIRFSVPTTGHVTLKVFNVKGAEVATLINKKMESGTYEVPFNANHLNSGAYFYRLQGNGFEISNKMILLR